MLTGGASREARGGPFGGIWGAGRFLTAGGGALPALHKGPLSGRGRSASPPGHRDGPGPGERALLCRAGARGVALAGGQLSAAAPLPQPVPAAGASWGEGGISCAPPPLPGIPGRSRPRPRPGGGSARGGWGGRGGWKARPATRWTVRPGGGPRRCRRPGAPFPTGTQGGGASPAQFPGQPGAREAGSARPRSPAGSQGRAGLPVGKRPRRDQQCPRGQAVRAQRSPKPEGGSAHRPRGCRGPGRPRPLGSAGVRPSGPGDTWPSAAGSRRHPRPRE